MDEIEGICTVMKDGGEFKISVSRDKNGVFHCERLKNGRCNLDKGICHSRRYLPYLAAIDANTSLQQRQPART